MSHIFLNEGKKFYRFYNLSRLETTDESIYGIEAPFLAAFQGLEPVLLSQRYGSFHGRQCRHSGYETTDEDLCPY